MTFAKISLLIALMTISSHGRANDKTLFIDGVNAAVHGDIALDKGEWRNKESFSALRIKAGFQVIRIGFAGVTIGMQKVGFYTAQKNWTKAGANRTHFDYRGPVAELHLFPSSPVSFAISGSQGKGYSFTEGDNAKSFPVDCGGDMACAATRFERSSLSVAEISGQVAYTIRSGMQIFLGAGSRSVSGSPGYEVRSSTTDASGKVQTGAIVYDSFNTPKWKMDTQFFLVGLRGTTL